MHSFVYHNPVKVIFGRGTISLIGEEIKSLGFDKVMLVFGQGSIHRNGVYEQVVASLLAAGVTWMEFGGVRANPVLPHAREGIAVARREKIGAILAVGGGSVIDEAKVIAAGAATTQHDVWDFYMRRATIAAAVPIFTVLTMSATGTEMNGNAVITNEATKQKIGMNSPHLYPRVSVLDPETLYTIPALQSAYGSIDAVCHLLESYFTADWGAIPLQDRYVEGIVRTLVETAAPMISAPRDFNLRATFMWGATLAWNGTAPAGVGAWWKPNHLIGHAMSALHDTPHGASLAISLSGLMPWYAESPRGSERLAQLGRAVFGTALNTTFTAEDTIEKFCAWFRELGVATTLAGIGAGDDISLRAIAKNVATNAPLWGLDSYADAVFIESILRRCR